MSGRAYLELVEALGAEHPLARAERAVEVAREIALDASALLIVSPFLILVGASPAIAVARSAALVTIASWVAVMALVGHRRRRVHDVIVAGPRPASRVVRPEIRRLTEPAHCAKVAAALDSALTRVCTGTRTFRRRGRPLVFGTSRRMLLSSVRSRPVCGPGGRRHERWVCWIGSFRAGTAALSTSTAPSGRDASLVGFASSCCTHPPRSRRTSSIVPKGSSRGKLYDPPDSRRAGKSGRHNFPCLHPCPLPHPDPTRCSG
jgi:hypothetical protein